jgi:hypothetical protein
MNAPKAPSGNKYAAKPDNERRVEKLHIRLTSEELRRLRADAAFHGLSVSALCRLRALGG